MGNGFGVLRRAATRPERAGVGNLDDARGDAASGKSLAREEREACKTELFTIRPRALKRTNRWSYGQTDLRVGRMDSRKDRQINELD